VKGREIAGADARLDSIVARMPLHGASLALLLLALPACNFRIDPNWTPRERETGPDAAQRDAGLEAGALAEWCRDQCAADDQEECTQVVCADAAVCADEPLCDRCLACRDR
jgi:hypothetical protein